MKQTIRITVTDEKYVSFGGARLPVSAWCPRCDAVTTMLTPDQAAALTGVSTRQIFRWVETERLHIVETGGVSPFVCLASLPSEGVGGETVICDRINLDAIKFDKEGGSR